MSRRKQQRNNYSESDSSSDDDDAPEEVSTSNWGKETFLSKKQSEQNAKDEIKRIATERRKAIADKIRKRQEESKKQKALKLKQEEEERQRRIANGEEEEKDDEDDEYEYNNNNNNNNNNKQQRIDYTKPQLKEGFHIQVLPDDDDDEHVGYKKVEKSALDFAQNALYRNQNRVPTHLAISTKRKGRPAYHFNQNKASKKKKKRS